MTLPGERQVNLIRVINPITIHELFYLSFKWQLLTRNLLVELIFTLAIRQWDVFLIKHWPMCIYLSVNTPFTAFLNRMRPLNSNWRYHFIKILIAEHTTKTEATTRKRVDEEEGENGIERNRLNGNRRLDRHSFRIWLFCDYFVS